VRIVAYVVVLVIAAVLVMYAVGRTLPVAHLASRGERFAAPRDTVWAVVTDVAAFASWRRDISSVEMLSPVEGRPAWREVSGSDRVEYVAEEMVAPERLVTRITTTGLPYGGRWRWELTPDAGGTRVTITEEGEVYNPLFRFLMKYVFGETSTIEKVLADLGKRLAR
jgi:Polyketide cyclase / dehydrase and lipid transport